MSAALLVLGAPMACKRCTAEPERALVPSAAGGTPDPSATTRADASDAIIEGTRAYAFRSWSFPLERYDLRIEDVAMETSLDAVLERTGAELVVNGGFFDPNGAPVGLAVSGGAVLSRLSAKMSGGVVTSDGARARLWETESFTMPERVRFAVQCKPRLVVDGIANVKRDDGMRAARTALCLRDGGATVDVFVVHDESGNGGPSLFALGGFLAERGCEGALNLDGGPSTGAAWRDDSGVRLLAPRKGVRHALAFTRRPAP